jgi:hypothetical protein
MGDDDQNQDQQPDQGSSPSAGGTVHSSTEHGVVASHPERATQPFLVAPTTASDFNTLGLDLVPVACLSLHDILFEFDSSFPLPIVAIMLKELPGLREKHKSASGLLPPISIFGHADPVGGHAYNKPLSGRRARAIYGAITHDLGLWQQLNSEEWHSQKIAKTMQDATGKPDGTPLKDLMQAYMNVLFASKLQKSDFLGKGADAQNKGDIQGCSDFNLQVLLSKPENQNLTHQKRNSENQPNRRVVVFLFRPGLNIHPNLWPCPAAVDSAITACRKRFFGPPKTGDVRILAGSDRREFAKTGDTFACRFYDRVAHLSPCEGGLVVPIHVFLKLVFRDPEGNDRSFPPKTPVTVVFGDGSELQKTVTDDGKVSFDTNSSRQSFTLKFAFASSTYIASAPGAPSATSEQLVAEADVDGLVQKGFRVFLLPPKWTTAQSDWSNPSLVNNVFPLAAGVTSIGSASAPSVLRLDPHWQFLKFLYFDRKLKQRLSILPIMMEGFDTAKGGGNPQTRSNWTTSNGCQCLPWILRVKKKPDQDTLLRFKTADNTFIESSDSAASRKMASGTAHDQPSADRLRFYDLPKLWKSTKYFTTIGDRKSLAAGPKMDVYEKLASEATSFDSPLEFWLDDMVLTDQNLQPVAWVPKHRAALFINTFHFDASLGSSKEVAAAGLYNSDDADNKSSFTKLPKFETTRNYIADYPDWTRLVIADGNMFEAFDQRTVEGKGEVVGARAALRWVNSPPMLPVGHFNDNRPGPTEKPFFTIQPFYAISRKEAFDVVPPTNFIEGRLDVALLRCCDADGDTEICTLFQYERHDFDFAPPHEKGATPLKDPLKSNKAQQASWANTAVVEAIGRWNAADGVGDLRAVLVPQDESAHKLRCATAWFAQVVSLSIAHMKWAIFEKNRAGTDTTFGTGGFEAADIVLRQGGWATTPHEFGHVAAHGDEYLEPVNGLSYGQGAIFSYAPGSPYNLDRTSMMQGNISPRHRHFWHPAEWLHSLGSLKFPFQVKNENDTDPKPLIYKLPIHPKFPKFSYFYYPLATVADVSMAGKGQCDMFFYPLGRDKYPTQVLPDLVSSSAGTPPADGFDGIVVVLVKFHVNCHSNDGPTITTILDRLHDGLDLAFNSNWLVSGKLDSTAPTGTVTFDHAYLHFDTRYIVPNFSKKAKEDTAIATAADYAAQAAKIEATHHVHHFIDIVKKGNSGFAAQPKPKGRLNLLDTDKLEAIIVGFFYQMLGLADQSGGSLQDQAAAIEPLIQLLIKNAKVTPY